MLEKIETLLAKRAIRQSELEKQVGLAANRISKWKGGKGEPTGRQLVTIARVLGVTAEYLADDAMDTPPVVEISDDERFLIGLIRDMGIDRATAVKRLTESPIVTSSSPSYGDRKAAEKPRKGRGDIA